MIILHTYINTEFSYIDSLLHLQKGYNEVIPKLAQMRSAQQEYIQNKSDEAYNKFNNLQKSLNNTIQTIQKATANLPSLDTNNNEIINDINQEANALKENMDIAKNFNINKSAIGNDYILSFYKRIENLSQNECYSLAKHSTALLRTRNYFTISTSIFIISIILFSYIVCGYFIRVTKNLSATKQKLNEENIELESKIMERTKDLENARLHAEKERQRVELLLQDTSHRVGNSLATVASLLSLQANRSKNEKVAHALISARDRIQTIASAHRRLRLGTDMETTKVNEFLQSVIHDIELSMPNEIKKRVSIVPELQSFSFSSRDATTLGIVVGELLTNAIKHAFPPPKTGEIHVFFGKRYNGPLCLIIEDNGTGFCQKNDTKQTGLGLLVAKQLCIQFDCEPIYEIVETGGTKVTIDLSSIEESCKNKSADNYINNNEN